MHSERVIRSNSRHGNFRWYVLRPREGGLCDIIGRLENTDSDKPGAETLLLTRDSYQEAFDWLVDINGHPIEQEYSESRRDFLLSAAREEYASDEINIDEDAELSEADDGCWVQGWLWVYTGDDGDDLDADGE